MNKHIYRSGTILALALAIAGLPQIVSAQQKIGIVRVDYVLSQLPQMIDIEVQAKSHGQELQKEIQAKVVAFQKQVEDFQRNQLTMSDAEKQEKGEILKREQAQLQEYERLSRNSTQKKQAELMQPLLDKITQVIKQVAKEEKFTHIFQGNIATAPIIVYIDEKYDITDKVLKAMKGSE